MSADPYLTRYGGQPADQSGRWPGWFVVLSVLVAFVVAGFVAVAVAWWWLTGRPPTEVEVDSAKASALDERLAPVLDDFDAVDLTDSGASSRGAAVVDDCFIDSGQVHQPSAVREWSVPTVATGEEALDATPVSREAALSIAEQLRQHGWEGGQALTPGDWTELTLPGEEYTITATVSAYGEAVFVSADAALDVCA